MPLTPPPSTSPTTKPVFYRSKTERHPFSSSCPPQTSSTRRPFPRLRGGGGKEYTSARQDVFSPPPPPLPPYHTTTTTQTTQQPPNHHHQLFTCTFCWTISPSRPHILGRQSSARLACGPCYRALIDLAICWVCGEVVVRGQECVSLGWCFWHRACYGCLLCGNRGVVQGTRVEELFAESRDGGVEGDGDGERVAGYIYSGRGRRRREMVKMMGTEKGREIDQVPLCANCLAEVDLDNVDNEVSVVQRVLRRMDQTGGDGGLNRSRWEGGRWSKETVLGGSKGGAPAMMGQTAAPSSDRQHQRGGSGGHNEPNHGDGADSSEPLTDYGDSGDDEEEAEEDEAGYPVPPAEPSTIYVSMLDPIGLPAFRPSPTKPIPHWMELIPHRADGRLGRGEQRNAVADLQRGVARGQQLLARPLPHEGYRAGSNRSSYASTICPTKSTKHRAHNIQPTSSIQATSPTNSVSPNVSSVPYKTSLRGRSFVVDEPLTLPSSLNTTPHHLLGDYRQDNLSTSTYSTYDTPPEYPPPPGLPVSAGKRPPGSSFLSFSHDFGDDNSYANTSHYIPQRRASETRNSIYHPAARTTTQSILPMQTHIIPTTHSSTETIPTVPQPPPPSPPSSSNDDELCLARDDLEENPPPPPSRSSSTISHRESIITGSGSNRGLVVATSPRSPIHRHVRERAEATTAVSIDHQAGDTMGVGVVAATAADAAGASTAGDTSPRDDNIKGEGGMENQQQGQGQGQGSRGSSGSNGVSGGGNNSGNTNKRRSVQSGLRRLFGW